MNAMEFARAFLKDYKIKGAEIVPKYCPYCGGGNSKDRETFALNFENNTFNCKRGSCGHQGHFTELCKDFGVEADKVEWKAVKKNYKKPEVAIKPATNKVDEYLKARGISKEIADTYQIGTDEKGNMVFPYYDENSELTFVKYRKPKKLTAKDKPKMWREADTKPILFGMNLCEYDKPLIITEGEFDCMSIYEAGVVNVVSVPSGAEDLTWIEECWDWLERFEKIIFYGDNDPAGQKMIRNAIVRLGEYRCYIAEHEYKDANEVLYRQGKEAIKESINTAKPIPIKGLIDLADVVPLDVSRVERVTTGIKHIDNLIGGFLFGEFSVWTGRRGEGKSTYLGQMMLEAVNAGESVCVYSGELRADRFQYWINLQAAGKENISFYQDDFREKKVAYVEKGKAEKIRDWYRSKFWLYDNEISRDNTEDVSIMRIFEYAAKRYGCKVFLIDNLMTADFQEVDEQNYYRRQSEFVGKLVHFAKVYNCHVHLVAHPRKTTKKYLGNDDVSGIADITNRADNVFSVNRLEDESFDTKITIMKNRSDGVRDKDIFFMFDETSKRFYLSSDKENKKYGWEESEEIQESLIE